MAVPHIILESESWEEIDKTYLLALQWTNTFGSLQILSLLELIGRPQLIWEASAKELLERGHLTEKKISSFFEKKKEIDICKLPEILEKKEIRYIAFWEDSYPKLLRSIYSFPVGIFYKGDWFDIQRPLAMVGSRRSSAYGRNVAFHFSRELAQMGVSLISGGARGIDAKVHEGALEGKGKTIAVMGCGLDVVYPSEHEKLFKRIENHGVLISEYPPHTPPLAQHFPVRNRIIAGLAKGTVVVEAAAKSGSLITAEIALSEGRDVFAVPGSVLCKEAEGVHWLLRQGAIALIKPEDVLGEYGWFVEKDSSHISRTVLSFTVEENKVLSELSSLEGSSLEQLLLRTNLPMTALYTTLVKLEMKGVITQVGPQQYILVNGG